MEKDKINKYKLSNLERNIAKGMIISNLILAVSLLSYGVSGKISHELQEHGSLTNAYKHYMEHTATKYPSIYF